MKYIFRYTLLTQFTQKQSLISKEQLVEALKTSKFTIQSKDLDTLITKHGQCISQALKSSEKRDLQSILKDSFEKEELTDSDTSDILAVWEAEKHLIFKKIINQNVKSCSSYQGINWAIRKGVAARSGTLSQTPTICLHLKDRTSIMEASLSKEEFSHISESAKAGAEFLNQLFQVS